MDRTKKRQRQRAVIACMLLLTLMPFFLVKAFHVHGEHSCCLLYTSDVYKRQGIHGLATRETYGYHSYLQYLSLIHIFHLNYRVLPKLNLFAKGMYETASVAVSYTHLW